MQQNKPHIYTECRHFRGFIENKKTLVKQTEIVAKMHCYHLATITNKETNSESIRNPIPSRPFSPYSFPHSVVTTMTGLHHLPSYFGLTTVVTALL